MQRLEGCQQPGSHIRARFSAEAAGELVQSLPVPGGANQDGARVMRGENEHPIRLQDTETFSQTALAPRLGNQVIQPVEGENHRAEAAVVEPRQVGSIGHLKFQLWKLLPTSANHLLRVVQPQVARGDAGEVRSGAASSHTQIKNSGTARNVLLKQEELARREIIERAVMSSYRRLVPDAKIFGRVHYPHRSPTIRHPQ